MKKLSAYTVAPAILCLLLLFALPLQAQLQASFTADKTGGCSPLTVSFTNTSTGTTAGTQYHWDFGNGNTSTLQHASVVLTTEKTYTVKLTVTNGNQSSTRSMDIMVHEKPVVDFTTDITRGCLPLAVKLTAAATQPGNAGIASYHWDFGDGYTSEVSTAATTHTYQTKQPVTVSLTVKNNYGCHTTLVKKDIIEVLPLIKADFESDKRILCQVSDPVQFTSKSQGPGTLTYHWDFGNGQTSTAANPAPVLGTKGLYTVKLTVNSSEGCTAVKTQTDYLNVANYTTDIQLPASTCENTQVTLKALCFPQPDNLIWTIDGQSYYYQYNEIQTSFHTAGTHTIKLTATYGTCTQEVTRTIMVNALPNTPDFDITNNNVCGAGPVTFKDLSTDAVKREWCFNYYYWQTPEIVDATAQQVTHTYTQDNVYNVSLKTYNAAGCSRRIVKQVSLLPPVAQIIRQGDNPWGSKADCDPATISFKATSLANIVKYKWIFDNNVAISTDPEPTYTFRGPGNHGVRLEFETDKGCKGQAYYAYDIKVRTKPKADFVSESGTKICGNTRVYFRSNDPNYTIYQYWYINDNYSGSSYYNTFDWQFNEKGKYTIRLISGEYGCQDTMTKVDYIEVLPPFPKITKVENSCTVREQVTFSQASRYAEKWIWDFGDGQTTTFTTEQPTVSHNYTANGEYKVVLTAVNGQCSVRDSMQAYVLLKPQPVLSSPQAAVCVNEPLTFTISNLPNSVYPGYWVGYFFEKFEYGDGSPFTGQNDTWNNFVHPLPYTGKLTGLDATKQNLRVIVRESYHGCLDTSNYMPLVVRGSVAGYKLLNNDICFSNALQIQDTSHTSTGGTIKRWDWDFGDGQTLTTYQSGIVTHQYNNPGAYNIVLKITDDVGCVSTPLQTMQTARLLGPKADFTPSATTIPLNATVYFNNTSNDFPYYRSTYQWNFGDGQTATGFHAQHTFPVAGKYPVKLTATDPVTGCRSEFTREITVQPANAYFNFTQSFIGQTNCLPLLASFVVTSVNADSLSWDFGDGTTAGDVKFPKHIYEKPGKYIITLTAYGANGLAIKYKDSILINTPQVSLSNAVWEGCPGHAVNWNLSGVNTAGYIWDFGDGSTSTAQDGTTTHPYALPGTYSPTLLVKDANGCLTTAAIHDKVVIHPNPVIQVTPATGAACLGQPIRLKATGAATYTWSPAAGLSDPNSDQPMAFPPQTTTYNIEGADVHGCKSSKSYNLTIHQPFTVQLDPEATLCTGDKLTLRAAGADRYSWIHNTAGLSNPQSNTPVANPVSTTTYTVVGYDNHGCFTDTAQVMVAVHPRPAVDAGRDVEVQAGERVQLSATSDPGIIRWSWAPPAYLSCTNCQAPVSTPQSDMKYTVTVTNQYGCEASDEVIVKLVCDESRIRIPNAITPNGDRNNDRFVVKGVSAIKHLVIYNRWGNKVFERQNFLAADESACWDGNLNGIPQPTGTYVYFIEMQCPKGESFMKKGTVMVIR